jgi:citrate lyase subunit beta/citryl-CoA lyase
MKKLIASSGNAGPKVRSDCEITLELTSGGGIIIDLSSRVKALYGVSIKNQVLSQLAFYGIENAIVRINDSGALPFVISARLEAAIRQLTETNLEYLPELIPENCYSTKSDRFRFARLYLPGNTPGLMLNAGLHSAEGIILDLEDSVAPEKKDEARILVRNALRQINFYGAERMVRINQGTRGLDDLKFVIPHNVNLIIIPKCENAGSVKNTEAEIENIKKRNNLSSDVYLMPIIESALGVENAYDIARSSENVVAMALGLEDYTADLGVPRSPGGTESLYARMRIVVAARAAGIQPIDSVFSDVGDMEGLMQNVRESKALGFEGMGCIHPRQIQVIRQGFAPEAEEIEKSKKIVAAFETARQNGLGVVALGTRMIDPPVVTRAQKTLDLAVRLGLLNKEWLDEVSSGGKNEH